MANIKLNSTRHEAKSNKIKRNHTLKSVVNKDKSGLKPSSNLNTFGRSIFKAIVDNNEQLSNADNSLLNLLCNEYQLYLKMSDYITHHGAVDDKGRKSSQYMIYKNCVDQILKISDKLNLTPNNRISSTYHTQDKEDPVKAVLR